MEHGIKRLNRELIRRGAILNIYKDTMRLPNGEIEEWDYIEHRMGAAAVVAVPEPGKVLMVHQYRPALERMTLEIPAGSRDSVTEEYKSLCCKRVRRGDRLSCRKADEAAIFKDNGCLL